MRTDRYQEERRKKIVELLSQQHEMAVDELSATLNVTGATIRTDLTALMSQGKVIRTLGKAIIMPRGPVFPLADRLRTRTTAKKEIGKLAASLVSPGDVIALDASSTSLAMAPYLKNMPSLTILTNCLAVANEFVDRPAIKLIMPGGYLQHEDAALTGSEVAAFVNNLRVQTSFMGARSLSLEYGIGDSDPGVIDFKKALMRISKKVVIVADSSKWEMVSLTNFSDFKEINTLVTDSEINTDIVNELTKRGVTVLYGKN
ncbi:MAG: DeoR/GlpR transcriptional regulator [Fibrobacteres bacterium]|nr:DeoR/GlpR transcriptional regulator [Fibrobacterota bacterium]